MVFHNNNLTFLPSFQRHSMHILQDELYSVVFCIVGSLLLDSLLSYLTTKEHCNCKAAYLHVLSTNQTAIRFYERRNFNAHSYLPYYYSIQGKPRDGYSYVLYINGGKPPWSLLYPLNFVERMTVISVICQDQFYKSAHQYHPDFTMGRDTCWYFFFCLDGWHNVCHNLFS